MTTLPQTTPMRLPRPAGAGQIAIPNAAPAGALGAPASGGVQMTGADVWRVFRTNWWLILGMVVVAAIVGYFANDYLANNFPKFTAEALVKVQLPEEVFTRDDADEQSAMPQQIELEQKTHVRGLLQPALMLEVLTNSDKIRQTSWFQSFNGNPELAKEDLLKHFNVQPIADSRLILVEMTYRERKDTRTIVEEIVNRYIAEQRQRASDAWSMKGRTLDEQYSMHEREYKKITDELTNNSTRQASRDSFHLFSLLQTKQHELLRLTEARQVADHDWVEAKNEYDTMEAMINSGETPPEVEIVIFSDPVLAEYQKNLDAIESRMSGPNSPNAANMLRNRQLLQQKIEDRREQLRTASMNAKKVEVETKMRAFDQNRKLANDRIAAATAELTDFQAAAGKFKMLEDQQKTLKDKMDEISEELDKIQHRKLPSSWSPVTWFTMPPVPETPSFPKLHWTLSAAVLIGLGLSIGIAFLREITDTSVRSPRDIARVGQMNLLGMIPHESDDPQAAGARLPLVIFDAPHSMAAEEFRKLRTRLQHTASLDSTRSILVSSANPGDGKTMVACNLAAGLALNGRRILLVDANFRRPEIHNLFEVANEQGFSDALNDLSTFDTLVRDTPVQNLYVMPTGPKPVNATELLESQLLIDFIERALEDYDHVIFDSGPLLLASETMALAPRVDGVLTVVRARANSRGVLQRMRDGLRQVKAEHLGVVLNAVRSTGGGYYGRNIKTYYAYQNS